MKHAVPRRAFAAAAVSILGLIGMIAPTSSGLASADGHAQIKHVLLISVDGMHQSDLDWYVANHPNSELARLATGGAEYTNAQTPDPSDSDPGGTGLMTGADPKTLGIYYDDEYSHGVFPPGTTNCSGPVPGGNVIYDSPDDKLPAVPDLLNNGSGNTFPSFDEGGSIYPGGIDTNPGLIMNLSPHPQSGLNPATYPVDPKTCQPIQPWDFLGVNTIFQVIHNAGMRTAWSDKHAIYTSYNGPGSNGSSINDFFGPEIDSQAVEPNGVPYPVDGAWTADNAATKQYDSYKVQAVINWINGHDHSGTGPKVGTPAIYGMNFQTVSTAEKLKSSPAVLIGPDAQGNYTEGPSLPGGYVTVNGQQVPGPLLQSALDYVNNALQRMADTIQADGEADSTAIILTAKHGQSPLNNNQLQRIDDGPIIAGVNAAWAAHHPSNPTLVVQEADDDGLLWWLSDRSQAAADFVKRLPVDAYRPGGQLRRPDHHRPALRPAGDLRRPAVGAILRRLELRSASPRRVRDRAGRHDIYDRLEDRRTRRRQPGRSGRSARRLCAGHRPCWPVKQRGGDDPGRSDDLEASRTVSELASGRPARGHTGPTHLRRPGLTAASSRAAGWLTTTPQLSTRPRGIRGRCVRVYL